MHHHGFETATDALEFMAGGRARFTLTSAKTGKHFTYRIAHREEGKPFFVSVLNGPDNEGDYLYIGFIYPTRFTGETVDRIGSHLQAGRKGHPDALSYKALDWTLAHLIRGTIPEEVTVQHEGRCCRCGRTLTHPESVASGIGPECASKRS